MRLGFIIPYSKAARATRGFIVEPGEYKPAIVRPRRLFTPEYAKEMKILINEVLDERDGKRGISYFDTDNFKHYVGEDEPPYEKWV